MHQRKETCERCDHYCDITMGCRHPDAVHEIFWSEPVITGKMVIGENYNCPFWLQKSKGA